MATMASMNLGACRKASVLDVSCRKKERDRGKDHSYPYKVIEITPPPKNLGIRCFPSIIVLDRILVRLALFQSCFMESFGNDIGPCLENQDSQSVNEDDLSFTSLIRCPCQIPYAKQSNYDAGIANPDVKHVDGSVINQKHSDSISHDSVQQEELPNMAKFFYRPHRDKCQVVGLAEDLDPSGESCSEKEILFVEDKSVVEHHVADPDNSSSCGLLVPEYVLSGSCQGDIGVLNNHSASESAISSFSSSPGNAQTATDNAETKRSVTDSEAIDISKSCDIQSRRASVYRHSTDSDVSDESSSGSLTGALYKPHKANDKRWEAIGAIQSRQGALGLNHFKLLTRLGCGDIGFVYLSELSGAGTYFAMKVMDKSALASRKKLPRAQTELEILQSLDHPFLPTLYSHFETEKFSCLVMEFCPGGDLHALRQRQPANYFSEKAARFYVAEILLALEYLHMLGIIYRDLKPENVLVREDGHIMLSDFDLSLRCAVCPTLAKSSNSTLRLKNPENMQPNCGVEPDCAQPACFGPGFLSKSRKGKKAKLKSEMNHQITTHPELIAEPTNARSMSFVGTHEYLAPEIIKGEGHGSAVDWWTFGIFLYELLFGKTPFKGAGNRATLFNVIAEPLRFPDSPPVSFAARDLIRGLLVKEPQHRLAYRRGATEIKQHPFFQNVNWALIRSSKPPGVPKRSATDFLTRNDLKPCGNASAIDVKPSDDILEIDFF